jgi:hypothetical protein
MLTWLVALIAGLLLAALAYRVRPAAPALPVFALRAFAGTMIVALLLDAPLGPSRPLRPWVGLDVSASWRASGDPAAWPAAVALVDSLRGAGADSVLLFGDSVRADSLPSVPRDRASLVGPLVEAAIAVGRPLILVTDGALDDPERATRLPRGSAVRVVTPAARPDAAIALLDAPGGALGGDTVHVRVVVKAGAAGSGSTALTVALDARAAPATALPTLQPFEEREIRVAIPVPASDATRRLTVALGGGDAVPENDTASAPLVVSGAAAATFVSTAPDEDARYALSVLRGTRRGPVQGFWRVAPGQWRVDGSMRPTTEAAVRQAAVSTPLLVLHGDTAVFGAPRALARAALVLIAPPAAGDDYYPSGTRDSPLAAALAGVPWDSLAPVDVAPVPARGFAAVVARRARRLDERTVVQLEDGAHRTALVPASGLWRWRLRGGRSADAFDAVWGSIFDWVGAEPPSAARLASRNSGRGEWVPRRATIAAGAVGEGVPMDRAPRALGAWWLSLLAITALCAEWLLRRRIGLR